MYSSNIRRYCWPNEKFYSTFNAIESASGKRIFPVATAENQYELLSDVINPWWSIDYVQQLVFKKAWSRSIIEKLKSRKIQNRFRTVIHDVIPSPVIESYRCKDEFSIRTGIDGNPKTVGYFIGSHAHGNVICVPPTKLITTKEEHIHVSQVFQSVIRESKLRACHDLDDGGFWRGVMVKSNRAGEMMAVVTAHPKGASPEEAEEAKGMVRAAFLSAFPALRSLYFQLCKHTRCTAEQAPYELLHGETHLYENYDDIVVRISPDSFCQINTDAALLLYQHALAFLRPDARATLLDLCCGIGTISLLASKLVRGCIGIEHIGQAVDDAVFNAKHNDITNCHFIAGRIEQELKGVISELASDVILVINPGRAGINRRVVSLLRQRRNIERFVYIACKADNPMVMHNLTDLCSRSFDTSVPFSLTDVQGVDLFPQTPHCELILCFHR